MRSQSFITGLGCISNAGWNLAETMERLYSGSRSPKPPNRIACQLEQDYPIFEVSGLAEQANDLSVFFAETAIKEALLQSGWDEKTLREHRVGVFLGSTAGCFFNKEDYYREHRDDKSGDPSYIAQVLLKGSIANRVSKQMGLTGPSFTLSNACASGTDAIGLAAAMVEKGECDIALAGGCDEIVRMVYLGFISLMNTSDSPCLPFSKSRKGLNLGEGAGICVLESPVLVRRRGIKPLGSIEGYATVSDSYHITAPEPSGRGLRAAFCCALKQAGIKPEDVAFINTHGTGTIENDRVEGRVIADIFGDHIAVTPTKAYTGHTLGAAGGLEAVIATQCLIDQKIPGAPDYDDFDPDCFIKPKKGNQEISGNYACSSSLAFGGVNSVIVIGRES
ncbi:MAG: beta-ketoacyl-[acyl-carrier-protein] synthase family protein [Firmicutes bacterium]|nr:beta-ketoacyl-[acyl-carrier-protein] synthase family protein [Bacillota bacterium]